jgi:hypothetical protein
MLRLLIITLSSVLLSACIFPGPMGGGGGGGMGMHAPHMDSDRGEGHNQPHRGH